MANAPSGMRSILILASILVLGASDTSLAGTPPAAACAATKLKAAGKKAAAKLSCVAKAVTHGDPVDSSCLGKADDKLVGMFTKADTKGGCLATGDAASVGSVVDGGVMAIRNLLGVPSNAAGPASRCTAGQLAAAGKKAAAKMTCYAKAVRKGLPVDTTCLGKADMKYGTTFGKALGKGGCLTTTDALTLEMTVDDAVGAVVGSIPASPTTTTTTTITTTTLGCDAEPGAFAGITAQHNATRASASPTPSPALDPLCWSDAIATDAQGWADTCDFSHDPALGTLEEGQNLYAAAQTVGFPTTAATDAEPAWAAEAVDYDYATNSCSAVCGHYTQVVWRSTAFLGCGLKNCTVNSPFGPGFPNWTVVVCNYKLPGNVVGQRPY